LRRDDRREVDEGARDRRGRDAVDPLDILVPQGREAMDNDAAYDVGRVIADRHVDPTRRRWQQPVDPCCSPVARHRVGSGRQDRGHDGAEPRRDAMPQRIDARMEHDEPAVLHPPIDRPCWDAELKEIPSSDAAFLRRREIPDRSRALPSTSGGGRRRGLGLASRHTRNDLPRRAPASARNRYRTAPHRRHFRREPAADRPP
jgi:hypothetical protein